MSRYRARSKYNIYKVPKSSNTGCILYFIFLPIWLPFALLFYCFTNPYLLLLLLVVGFIVLIGSFASYFIIYGVPILIIVLIFRKFHLMKKITNLFRMDKEEMPEENLDEREEKPPESSPQKKYNSGRSYYSLERFAVECNAYLDHQDEMAQYEDVLNDNNAEQKPDPDK